MGVAASFLALVMLTQKGAADLEDVESLVGDYYRFINFSEPELREQVGDRFDVDEIVAATPNRHERDTPSLICTVALNSQHHESLANAVESIVLTPTEPSAALAALNILKDCFDKNTLSGKAKLLAKYLQAKGYATA